MIRNDRWQRQNAHSDKKLQQRQSSVIAKKYCWRLFISTGLSPLTEPSAPLTGSAIVANRVYQKCSREKSIALCNLLMRCDGNNYCLLKLSYTSSTTILMILFHLHRNDRVAKIVYQCKPAHYDECSSTNYIAAGCTASNKQILKLCIVP